MGKEAITFTDLDAAMREFHRVMRPGAVGVIYQVLTGPAMAASEAEMSSRIRAIVLRTEPQYADGVPGKRWFGRKHYGAGYSPASWEGWVSLAVFVAVVIVGSEILLGGRHSPGSIAGYVVFILIAVAAYVVLIVVKGRAGGRSEKSSSGRQD